jgi:hypothetical protein
MSAYFDQRFWVRGGLTGIVLGIAGCASEPRAAAPVAATAETAYVSELWGRNGEKWMPNGRLPDFSYAGYRSGELPIPDYPVTANVETFGARGDDEADDTAAFQAALAAIEAGAIWVPPGRYIMTGVLRVKRSGVVLRGAGEGKTTLFFPKPLQAIEPDMGETTSGRPASNYAWSGGFVRFEGTFGSQVLTPIVAAAQRGGRVISVADGKGLSEGQMVEVFLKDTPEDTLAKHLYSEDAGETAELRGRTTASLVTRVASVQDNVAVLDRRLRFDVRAEWQPVVRAFEPTVQDSGVEDLTFEFPGTPYGGHFNERGYNPVAFVNVAHCWARRVRFVNTDNGPMVGGAFNTVSDVVYESARAPAAGGVQGHHGIYLRHMGDHVFTRFDFRMPFVHDISVSNCAGVVVSNGKGKDLCFDHHKRAPYEILFSNIDLGKGSRPWKSGGGDKLGKNAGARVTFWNLRAAGPLPEPPNSFAPPTINLVGVNPGAPDVTNAEGLWREGKPGARLVPVDLHESQLRRRTNAKGVSP